MRVPMKLGAEVLDLGVPDAVFGGHWSLGGIRQNADPEAWARALRELSGAGCADAVRGRHVGLLVADGTRSWEPKELLPGILVGPDCALASAARVTAVVCTGTHAPDLPETAALAGRIAAVLERAAVSTELVVHDARAQPHARLGRTSAGTEVELLVAAADWDALLVLADMKPHFFAGYSNPVKYLIPGIASRETARGNHSLVLEEGSTFGVHPWHPDPGRRANPLAADMVEAFELALAGRPCFALVSFTAGSELLWAAGGDARAAAARGMAEVDRRAGVEIPPHRFLVVSPGGDPHDESLYTAQRALELSAAATRAGGEVLFLARCRNGIGPPAARERFFEPLKAPLAQIVAPPRSEYALYSHKPVKMARYLERLEALHLCSDLPAGEVASVHLRPVDDPQALLDSWARAGEPIAFLDDASKLAVRSPAAAG